VQWILSGYAIAFGGLLLAGGRATDLFGQRRMFMVGVAMFTFSSLLSALAWAGPVLIGARVAQGVAAAIMAPAEMAVLVTTFTEDSERTRAFALAGAVSAAGGSAGALVGGPVVQWLGWRWIFLINIPIGAVLLAMAPLVLAAGQAHSQRRLNLTGALTASEPSRCSSTRSRWHQPRGGRGRRSHGHWEGARSWARCSR